MGLPQPTDLEQIRARDRRAGRLSEGSCKLCHTAALARALVYIHLTHRSTDGEKRMLCSLNGQARLVGAGLTT